MCYRLLRSMLTLMVLSLVWGLRAEEQVCVDKNTGLVVTIPRGWRFDADRISPVLANFPSSIRVPVNLVPLNHAEVVIARVDPGVGDPLRQIEKYLDLQRVDLRETIKVRRESEIAEVIKVTSRSILPKGTEIDYFIRLDVKWFRLSVLYRGGAVSRQVVVDAERLIGLLRMAKNEREYPHCPGK